MTSRKLIIIITNLCIFNFTFLGQSTSDLLQPYKDAARLRNVLFWEHYLSNSNLNIFYEDGWLRMDNTRDTLKMSKEVDFANDPHSIFFSNEYTELFVKGFYKFSNSKYDWKSSIYSGQIVKKLYDGTKKADTLNNQSLKPDSINGLSSYYTIEKMNEDIVTLVYYTSNLKSEQTVKWRLNFKYSKGNYTDYQSGKTIELVPIQNEMEIYDDVGNMVDLLDMCYLYLDIGSTKSELNTNNYIIQLNKNEMVVSYNYVCSREYFIWPELREYQTKIIKANWNK